MSDTIVQFGWQHVEPQYVNGVSATAGSFVVHVVDTLLMAVSVGR